MPSVGRKRKAGASEDKHQDVENGVEGKDPETEEFRAGMQHFFEGGDDGDQEGADEIVLSHEDGRLRLRPDIVLDGPVYSGKKSSRKHAFAESESEEEDVEEGSDSDAVPTGAAEHDDDISSGEEDGLGWHATEGKDDELEALSRDYNELREQEELMLKNLRSQTDDKKKGEAVRNQKALWDKGLEYRIFLQKIMSGANRLPRGQMKEVFCRDKIVKDAYDGLTATAVSTLDSLERLQKAIVEQNPAISEAYARTANENDKPDQGDVAAPSPKSYVDEAWEQFNKLYFRLVPYRNSSLDRWQRKTQLSTGGAISKLKLRAFNQSISEQVAAIMRDPSRIVNRMQTRVSSIAVFGQAKPSSVADKDTNATDQAEEMGDLESVDDSEFYQLLLQEFFESSPVNGLDMDAHAIKKLRNKKRKVVDRRASKGRKIRYHVFDPLVNFCAPEPMMIPQMAEKLFANLFGQTKQDKIRVTQGE